ncbi:hypothetical protein HAX54_027793 [Datura stramonium]|uniref:Uncharacterized protein n=1 Tax=Datura stramonium TaxID=4076 RepID=A0ABS8V6B7_DATST|nr:hypothetical protein [Datura stramonium]
MPFDGAKIEKRPKYMEQITLEFCMLSSTVHNKKAEHRSAIGFISVGYIQTEVEFQCRLFWNSTARLPTFWINKLLVNRNYSITDFSAITPILLSGNSGPQYLCGFFCNYEATECLLGILSLVWSANRNRPVKTNATLQLGRDGNLVLADSDGTLVWSTNTAGKSVSGLNLTETGNSRFDKRKRTIWQSFDHPTDSLFPGRIWKLWIPNGVWKIAYVQVKGNVIVLYEAEFFRPSIGRKADLGCTELTSISCDSLQYHSLLEVRDTTYFAFDINFQLNSSIWFEGTKVDDCKTACLSNCSCKAVVWAATRRKNCLLLNEVFSIIDNSEGRDKTTVFLKVQNQSPIISGGKNSRPFKVIVGSIFAALMGVILSISTCFVLFKKRSQTRKAADLLELEPLLPGILTRFSYNELKIMTEDFSRKLGEGGFGSVYEGTLSNGTKIAVKHLDGLGQVKDSFLTEVNIVGSIHHVNLVKLIGFCAEKSERLLIYEYMINGSLDRWIYHKNQASGLTWHTRQRIISDIAKGLAYLHEDCSHKIIHLDIKPQNILLDQCFNAKISDFGLSKLIEKEKSKVVTRMRGTPGYLAPEWLSSVITEKVDVYAFGIVLLEILCGRKNLDWSQADEEDVHLLSVFRRKAEQDQLMDMVDKNNEDMQLHREAVTEMMSLAAWCLQGDFTKRPSMSLVVKALEGLVTVETNLDYNFTQVPEVGAGNQQREATISSKLPSVLSGPRFALSQPFWDYNARLLNSTTGLPNSWINMPSVRVFNSSVDLRLTPILQSKKGSPQFLFGFNCRGNSTTECLLGILLFHTSSMYVSVPQLVWSANRYHPVKTNATLQLGQDGNLVLADSDGTVVWSTNTTGKSVAGLNLTEVGNLVLFDKKKRAIWQSFDHPTDCLLPGQKLVYGRKLIASVSASNQSFSFTVLNGSLVSSIDTDPPQYYIVSDRYDAQGSPFYDFDGQTFTALPDPYTSETNFIKLGPDGYLSVYQLDAFDWKQSYGVLNLDLGNCGYPMACGRYSICTNNGQCNCPLEGNFFRPINRNPDLGCSQLTSISCNSLQFHSLIELNETTYFAFETNFISSSSIWFEGTKLEDCRTACLSNCSCKAAVCDKTKVFLKVQNSVKAQYQSPIISRRKQSRPLKVIVASTLAALVGIILSISTWFVVSKKRRLSGNTGDLLDLAPILPGILTRFSYNELKIITEDFSRKLGEGGFGSVYEGTLSNGNKIAVKRLNGVGQVKDSFLTEVKIVGSIHHVNLVKLIGFCAEKDHRVLIYEYMTNGSLDRCISGEKQETGLTWLTRQRIISDIAKGLAYLHGECNHKIVHLDIKPHNILLDQNFNAKISDFGLSKLIEKDKSKIVTRMRGTPGYLAPEWLRSVITEKVDVYAFGIVLLEVLCGRKNLDWSQADEEDVHLLSVFRRKAEQEQLMDLVDKNNEDMQLHREAVTEMMSLAAWCLQGDFNKRPSMALVVKVLEGLVPVETNFDFNFTNLTEAGAGNQQREATISPKLPSVLSGPRFASSQISWYLNASVLSSTAGLSTSWTNRPFSFADSTFGLSLLTPVLLSGNDGTKYHFCGFYCNDQRAECLLGIFFAFPDTSSTERKFMDSQLVWSANRDHPVKENATLQLSRDGNLVLADSDGTLVWSTNTAGKSVAGLNLTETGNLVLFDKANRTIWQSFDHPTDSLLPGQSLVSGKKLIASDSATNRSQGLFSLTIINGSWATYIDSDPPQFYYASPYMDSPYSSFDGQTLTALQDPSTSPPQFMKLGPDGHLRVYQWEERALDWKEISDLLTPYAGNCGYPMACGRYGICTSNGQCSCPPEENFFRPFNERKKDLGCSQLTSINCNSSRYHSFVELGNTTYFAFELNSELTSSMLRFEGKKLEDCRRACLRNCSCKAVVFRYDSDGARSGSCLLLNEVFSLIGNEDGTERVFLKVQNSSKAQSQSPTISGGKKSRPHIVIIGSTLAALFGIILSITACFVLFKKRTRDSSKAGDFLDLEPILPGMLTRYSYNELKIITEDFSKKLGEGGFGSVYEGTLSNGTKIAVKRLDGLGHVMESFLTEVKIVGGIHHVNLVKLIGFCAEKSHRLLIYEHMINRSLDRWISHKNQENGLTWHTRQRIITDIAKGLAYLHDECSQKIIHLDIKPQNILLDQNFNAKISDFGLSKLIDKDKSKVVTRMRGTPGYLAPEWLRSVITEKVDVYAFGIVLLEVLCGRKNVDLSQADEDVHLLSVFERKAEQQKLMDIVDKNNEDMQIHKEAVTEMMSIAAWCLQGDYTKRPSMSLVVKALEGLVSVETNLDYDFTSLPEVAAGNQPRDTTISSILPSVLSGPR